MQSPHHQIDADRESRGDNPYERKSLEFLLEAIKHIVNVIVVVDGLDECEASTQRVVCEVLCQLAGMEESVVKVMVTCREEERPLMYLRRFIQLKLSADTLASDVKAYVSSAVDSSIERGDLVLRRSSLKVDIIQSLVSGADGMLGFQTIKITVAR